MRYPPDCCSNPLASRAECSQQVRHPEKLDKSDARHGPRRLVQVALQASGRRPLKDEPGFKRVQLFCSVGGLADSLLNTHSRHTTAGIEHLDFDCNGPTSLPDQEITLATPDRDRISPFHPRLLEEPTERDRQETIRESD